MIKPQSFSRRLKRRRCHGHGQVPQSTFTTLRKVSNRTVIASGWYSTAARANNGPLTIRTAAFVREKNQFEIPTNAINDGTESTASDNYKKNKMKQNKKSIDTTVGNKWRIRKIQSWHEPDSTLENVSENSSPPLEWQATNNNKKYIYIFLVRYFFRLNK